MKISVNWLRRYVDVPWDVEELARRLTLVGQEVDKITSANPGFSGVRVGKVLEVAPHPDADRLRVAKVTTGDGTHEVVCGAPNCRAGLTVAYALPGARLPGMEITARKVRGVQSAGMLCGEDELGLGTDTSGIIELEELTPGADLIDALDLDDHVLDIGVTANRGDALSHLGIAREIAALTGEPLRLPSRELPRAIAGEAVPVEIDAPARCARYVAWVIRGLKTGPSPFWMRRLLTLVGVRPINNLVDVTNFVLFEYGQPLHAFDLRHVRGRRIKVREAKAGEQMATLDGVTRTFTNEDLLICDGEGPVAVAGVMGGLDSEVKDDTTDVLLESAWFEPASVRMTSRRLDLRSESSHRFERAVDPGRTDEAARRAVHLFAALSNGGDPAVETPHTDAVAREVPRPTVRYRPARANKLLGFDIPAETQREALTRFGFIVTEDGVDWQVQTPSHRGDVEQAADLVEEVARYVGYDQIPTPPPRVTASSGAGHARDRRVRALRRLLNDRGVHQALNFSFLGTALQGHFDDGPALKLVNPLVEDHAVLRRTLAARLVANAAHNVRHGARSIALFEVGKVFRPEVSSNNPATLEGWGNAPTGFWESFFHEKPGLLPLEIERLCVVLAGEAPAHWSTKGRAFDLFDLKGLVEDLCARAGRRVVARPTTVSWMVPGAAAELVVDDVVIGQMGTLHPRVGRDLEIEVPTFVAELDLAPLVDAQAPLVDFQDFGRFPASTRDLAVVLPDSVTAAQVLSSIEEMALPLVDSVAVFDVYRGDSVGPDAYSLGLSVTYRAGDRTLTDEAVSATHAQLVEVLVERFGAGVRGG